MRVLCAALIALACTSSADAAHVDSPTSTAAIAGDGSQQQSKQQAAEQQARASCEVISVHDGDTFRCRGDVRVRLLLIDAPEIDQPAGPPARDALRKLLPRASVVWLEYDVQRADRYGRTLAYAWTEQRGGALINRVMADEGWVTAVVFPPNVRRIDEIRAAVAAARAARRGIWGASRVCEPINHKKKRC